MSDRNNAPGPGIEPVTSPFESVRVTEKHATSVDGSYFYAWRLSEILVSDDFVCCEGKQGE